MKICKKCGQSDFYSDGHCKPCKKAAAKITSKRWYQLNLKSKNEYREKNSKMVKDSYSRYYFKNKENWIIKTQNRRNRKSGGKLSKNIVTTLYLFQKGKCACCGKSLKNGFHLDHFIPLARGGAHADWNMQLLTPQCNLKKGSSDPLSEVILPPASLGSPGTD